MVKKGFIEILLVGLLTLISAVSASTIYFYKNLNFFNDLSKASLSAQSINRKDLEDIKDNLLQKHFLAQTSINEFCAVSSGKNEEKTTTIFQTKDDTYNFRITTITKNKESSDYVVIDNVIYVKDFSDGKWWYQKIRSENLKEINNEEEKIIKPNDFKNEYTKNIDSIYNRLGKELCGDFICYKYEERYQNSKSKRIFWFDNLKFLLRKEEYEFGKFISINQYSYDNILISEPSPVKNLPIEKNIFEYLYQSGLENKTSESKDYEE